MSCLVGLLALRSKAGIIVPVLTVSFASVLTVELTLHDLWLGMLVSTNSPTLTYGPQPFLLQARRWPM